MQKRYWEFMVQKKFHIIYMGKHLSKCICIERWLNISLAIISTGSLAGLFITKQLQLILGIFLAISQIITAARPYLPYANRIKEIEADIAGLSLIYTDIEKDWYYVSNGQLTEEEINTKCYEYNKKWSDYDGQFLQNDSLPRNESIRDEATKDTNEYFGKLFS